MKRTPYILSAALTILLTGCYESDFVLENDVLRDITTRSASADGEYIYLTGESSGPSSHLYFEISPSEDFAYNTRSTKASFLYDGDGVAGGVSGYIYNWMTPGTYYYRLYEQMGSETVYAPNVESFTFENPVSTLDPDVVEARSAILAGHVDRSAYGSGYFLLSTNADFRNATRISASTNEEDADGRRYTAVTSRLNHSSRYYTKFCMQSKGITLEGQTTTFVTGDLYPAPMHIESISGTDSSHITVIVNGQGIDRQVFHIEKGEWVGEAPILQPDQSYEVTAFSGNPSVGYNSVTYKGYSAGDGQVPLSRCTRTVAWESPYLRLSMNRVTSQVTVAWPESWGTADRVILRDKKGASTLPGDTFNLNLSPTTYTSSYMGTGTHSVQGGQVRVTFNIPSVRIASGQVEIELPVASRTVLPCPALNLTGGNYLIEFDSTGVASVKVTPWTSVDGDDMTITPNL